MNQKHFLIYYKQGTGTFIVTEPRAWARGNQNYFPGFNFINAQVGNHPTTPQIEEFLINNFQFQSCNYQNPNVTVLFNFDPHMGL